MHLCCHRSQHLVIGIGTYRLVIGIGTYRCETDTLQVLIVHGKQDKVIAAKNSQKLAALIPNSRLVIWDETGHLPHEEHPERFIALTETFLQSL